MQYEMTISPWLLKLSDGRMGFIVLFFVLVLYNTFLNVTSNTFPKYFSKQFSDNFQLYSFIFIYFQLGRL